MTTMHKALEVRHINTAKAAQLTGVSKNTLRAWRARRIGPPYIAISPRRVVYSLSDIIRYLEERRVAPSTRG
jgi:predicted DNA-binding transcriptional regulator AlpA